MKIIIPPSQIENFCKQVAEKLSVFIAPEYRKGIYLKNDKIYARKDTYPYEELKAFKNVLVLFNKEGHLHFFFNSPKHSNVQITLN